MIRKQSYCLVLFAALLIPWLCYGDSAGILLVEDGKARFGLALADDAGADEQLAAEELCHFVEKMSGAVVPRVNAKADGPVIYLGRAGSFSSMSRLADLSRAAQDLAPEEYLIEAVEDDLYLLGGSGRGALWAVYGVLRELGCRWYMPGEIGEVIPQRKTLTIDGRQRTDGPDFFFRDIWYSWGGPPGGGPRFAEWKRRNRLFRPPVNHGHNLTTSMPPSASFDKRPELYSLVNGKREKQQVCTTNPEVIELISQTIIDYFDKYPDTLCYSLCPDDNDDFCECENCRALDAGGFDADRNKPIVTDRYVTFLNQVAERIQKRHPGKMVSMYAYINHSTAPVRTKVSPYVVVFFTGSVYCGGHGIGDSICASRMKMKSDLNDWVRMCPNVYIYDYDPIPGNLELPWPLFGARAREMPVYRKLGIKGMSIESHCSWATLSPNHWVSAQCLWSADCTADSLLRDFCDGFFGLSCGEKSVTNPTADAMVTFYRTLEHAMAEYEPMIEWGHREIPSIFTPDVMPDCRSALDQAFHSASGSVHPNAGIVMQRLQMVDLGFAYFERYLDFLQADHAGVSAKDLEEAYTSCMQLINRMHETNADFIEMQSAPPDLKKLYSSMVSRRPPKEYRMVTEWNAIGPFDNTDNKGHETVFPPERKIDLKATYDGLEGPVRWKIISPGKGKGYLNLLDQFSPKDWTTIYALNYLYVEHDMDAQFRVGSNDTLKIWLNNDLVWHFDEGRIAVLDDDIVPVHLKAGWNPVLLKVSQSSGNWGFYFRVTNTDGSPAKSARFALTPR
ncbi:MAG: DUF4838 domain-containing protein [bacterium]